MVVSKLRSGVLALSVIGGVTLAISGQVVAQDATPVQPKATAKSKPAKPAATGEDVQQPRDPARAQRSYETGVASYQAGRYEEAVNSLNAAVQAGGLSGPALARALYYRGAAFQAKGMPGQAISDLTSALWFKGGLSDQERADATRIRSEAYRAAGLNEQGGVSVASAGAAASSAATSQTITIGAADGSPATPQLSALPAEQTATPSGGGTDLGSVLGGLFGGLTGGSKSIETAAIPAQNSASPATDPTAGPVAGRPITGSRSNAPEVLPWGAVATPATAVEPTTPDETAQAKPAAKTAKPSAAKAVQKPAKQAAAVAPAAGGSYRIQVGTVKTVEEANALATRLRANAGLSGTDVSIDQTAFGGSTYYRVRVGPYASAADTKAPCQTLKQNGLDCLVTAQ